MRANPDSDKTKQIDSLNVTSSNSFMMLARASRKLGKLKTVSSVISDCLQES